MKETLCRHCKEPMRKVVYGSGTRWEHMGPVVTFVDCRVGPTAGKTTAGPDNPATCPVSVWGDHGVENYRQNIATPCGKPTVTDLCAGHQADRVRLGG